MMVRRTLDEETITNDEEHMKQQVDHQIPQVKSRSNSYWTNEIYGTSTTTPPYQGGSKPVVSDLTKNRRRFPLKSIG